MRRVTPLAVYAATVALTALAYFLGDRTLFRRLSWYEPPAIGFAAVTLGGAAQMLGAPLVVVLALPAAVGVVLLYLLMASPVLQWFLTLVAAVVCYVGLHAAASRFGGLHTLIPMWPLS